MMSTSESSMDSDDNGVEVTPTKRPSGRPPLHGGIYSSHGHATSGAGVGVGAGSFQPAARPQNKALRRVAFAGATGPSPMDDVFFHPADQLESPEVQHEVSVKPPKERSGFIAPPSSISRPDFDDSLRRVAVVLYQHIVNSERAQSAGKKFAGDVTATKHARDDTYFGASMQTASDSEEEDGSDSITHVFHEENFAKEQYRYTFLRRPRFAGTVYKMEVAYPHLPHASPDPSSPTALPEQKIIPVYKVPTVDAIYQFAQHLFVNAKLSAECSIVSLVYVERLMKNAGVQLLACNWRPVLLCGLLLASKVWQDMNCWNVEFSGIYPQYNLESVNRLEREFIQALRWDLFISGSLYAKYYFALRSMNERKNFRRRYMYIMNVKVPGSKKIAESSRSLKKQLYSKSV